MSTMHEKVIFIDRDGVINKKMPEGDYVKSWEEFEFRPGSIVALKLLIGTGYAIFVVTNQRGIARKLMSEDDLATIHKNMEADLGKHGIRLAGIYHCPHGYEDNCECRKPKPGLLLRAAREHDLDLTESLLIGDSESDMQAGIAAGCKTMFLGSAGNFLEAVKELVQQRP